MKSFALAVLMLSIPSFAQVPKETTQPTPKITTLVFGEGTALTAERDEPDALLIDGPRPVKFSSLIKVRENFTEKVLHSVSEL